uniref:Putative major royal jelly protein n=1 Tax=Triatoma infestans TaxID=30076 RepID=A0A023F809_TRIIF
MKQIHFMVLFIVVVTKGNTASTKLKEVFSWKELDYKYEDELSRNISIENREFVPSHNLPLGLDIWNDKVFITVPRWKSGVPSTLNYVLKNGGKSQELIPYPSWEFNNISNAENNTVIVNTFRIRADECDRLWVIDCGINDILGSAQQISLPKILIFDLLTDKLIREYKLKPESVKEDSFFANVVVDIADNETGCDSAFAYIPDLGSYGLIVYSWADNDSWRIKHHYFHFDPLAGNYHVGGVNFQWTDGIFGLALSPPDEEGQKTLYFHPLSSTREFAVSTNIVQNKSIASDSYYAYKVLGSRGPNSQATASMVDRKSGVLFYTQVNKNGVGCWNPASGDYSVDTNGLIAADNITMVFPNDLKVDRDSNLWVLTDRLPSFIYTHLDFNDTNFRVLSAPVQEIIQGTVCQEKK